MCMFVWGMCVCLLICMFVEVSYIICFLLHIYIDVEIYTVTSYNGITILQGDNVTLLCTPSVSDITLQWSYNDKGIVHHITSFSKS